MRYLHLSSLLVIAFIGCTFAGCVKSIIPIPPGEGGSGSGVKNAIFFDDVRVPAENLVGGENNGWKVATTHLEVEHGGTGRLADRRVVYEFIEMCRERAHFSFRHDCPDAYGNRSRLE